MSRFQKATRKKSRARVALIGPSGSGKTYTALVLARGLVGAEGRIAVIDTERGSASKYADRVTAFDVLDLERHSPGDYVQALKDAADEGYDVVVIDSLSHAWNGRGGALEMVDAAAAKERGNSFGAWRHVTPKHLAMLDAILAFPGHVIVTMRVKTEWIVEEVNGKKMPRKVGLAPVQRDGVEYEFDIVGDLDQEHRFVVTKSRCSELADAVIDRPGVEVAVTIRAWLDDGATPAVAPKTEAPRVDEGSFAGAVAGNTADAALEALGAIEGEEAFLLWMDENVPALSALPSAEKKRALGAMVAKGAELGLGERDVRAVIDEVKQKAARAAEGKAA